MEVRTLKDIDLNGKKCLVRCDFNVPQDIQTGEITDNRRIVSALDTIKYLRDNHAKIILCSHLGRPKGEFNDKYSLKPIAIELSKLLNQEVKLATDVVGDSAKKLANEIKEGEIVLLENLRFHIEEEENEENFSKELASLAEIYINDAFGTAHRAHSSTYGVTKYLPSYAGFLIEKEINFLSKAINNPTKPFIAILGGAKVSDKIKIIEKLMEKVDKILIAGGMAYTFFKAQGHSIGDSICEDEQLDLANGLLAKAESLGVEMVLPIDNHVAKSFSEESESIFVDSKNIPDGFMGLDIGPKTIEKYDSILAEAKTVMWNGPLGVCEFDKFAVGTNSIAKFLSQIDATTIIGGGDSAAAIEKMGLADNFTHISTGGGASLEFLEGKTLPGIEALLK